MIKVIVFVGILINVIAYGNFYSTILFFGIFLISRLSSNIFFNGERNYVTERDLSLWICSLFYLYSGCIELLIINFGSQLTVGPDASLF